MPQTTILSDLPEPEDKDFEVRSTTDGLQLVDINEDIVLVEFTPDQVAELFWHLICRTGFQKDSPTHLLLQAIKESRAPTFRDGKDRLNIPPAMFDLPPPVDRQDDPSNPKAPGEITQLISERTPDEDIDDLSLDK